jgi:hypothetical protein
VVRFEPVGPEDEAAVAQETDYVNHVFMQQNPGFMVLYSFIKDALLSKVGIVKVWWEEREEEERETYYDLTDDQFALLVQAVEMSEGAMQIIAHTIHNTLETATTSPSSPRESSPGPGCLASRRKSSASNVARGTSRLAITVSMRS